MSYLREAAEVALKRLMQVPNSGPPTLELRWEATNDAGVRHFTAHRLTLEQFMEGL